MLSGLSAGIEALITALSAIATLEIVELKAAMFVVFGAIGLIFAILGGSKRRRAR